MSYYSPPDPQRVQTFFDRIIQKFGPANIERGPAVVVAHALGSGLPFFKALDSLYHPVLFIPKAASVDRAVVSILQDQLQWRISEMRPLDIADLKAYEIIVSSLALSANQKLTIFDVGGKFATDPTLSLQRLQSERAIVVVEDTENGHQRYETLGSRSLPEETFPNVDIRSVARSLLKEPEDYWTGRGIVEATETILRVNYFLLGDLHAIVFGYGKIGRSIAHALREKRLLVHIVEVDAGRAVLAKCHGFDLIDEAQALDIGGLVFLATGGKDKDNPITSDYLLRFRKPITLTLATSWDDEVKNGEDLFGSGKLRPVVQYGNVLSQTLEESNPLFDKKVSTTRTAENFVDGFTRLRTVLSDKLEEYHPRQGDPYVRVVNGGRPPNFLFEASCGPYIFLVQAALLASSFVPRNESAGEAITQLSKEQESEVFAIWSEIFR